MATSGFGSASISRTTGISPRAPTARLRLTTPAASKSVLASKASRTACPIFPNPTMTARSINPLHPSIHVACLLASETCWRRGRDSNPWLFRVTGFQDQLHKPLGHLSVSSDGQYDSIFPRGCQYLPLRFFTYPLFFGAPLSGVRAACSPASRRLSSPTCRASPAAAISRTLKKRKTAVSPAAKGVAGSYTNQ